MFVVGYTVAYRCKQKIRRCRRSVETLEALYILRMQLYRVYI